MHFKADFLCRVYYTEIQRYSTAYELPVILREALDHRLCVNTVTAAIALESAQDLIQPRP